MLNRAALWNPRRRLCDCCSCVPAQKLVLELCRNLQTSGARRRAEGLSLIADAEVTSGDGHRHDIRPVKTDPGEDKDRRQYRPVCWFELAINPLLTGQAVSPTPLKHRP